jgi:hypothetical protein
MPATHYHPEMFQLTESRKKEIRKTYRPLENFVNGTRDKSINGFRSELATRHGVVFHCAPVLLTGRTTQAQGSSGLGCVVWIFFLFFFYFFYNFFIFILLELSIAMADVCLIWSFAQISLFFLDYKIFPFFLPYLALISMS